MKALEAGYTAAEAQAHAEALHPDAAAVLKAAHERGERTSRASTVGKDAEVVRVQKQAARAFLDQVARGPVQRIQKSEEPARDSMTAASTDGLLVGLLAEEEW